MLGHLQVGPAPSCSASVNVPPRSESFWYCGFPETREGPCWLEDSELTSLAHHILFPSTHLLVLQLLFDFLGFPPVETQHVAGPTPTHPPSRLSLCSQWPMFPGSSQSPRVSKEHQSQNEAPGCFPSSLTLFPIQPFPLNTTHFSTIPGPQLLFMAKPAVPRVPWGLWTCSCLHRLGKARPASQGEGNCCNYCRPPWAPGSCGCCLCYRPLPEPH